MNYNTRNISRNDLNNMTDTQIVQLLRDMRLPVIPVTNTTRNILIERIVSASQNPEYAEQVRQRQVTRNEDRRMVAVPPIYNRGDYVTPPKYLSYNIPPPGSPTRMYSNKNSPPKYAFAKKSRSRSPKKSRSRSPKKSRSRSQGRSRSAKKSRSRSHGRSNKRSRSQKK